MRKKRICLRITSILITLCFILNTTFLTIPNLAVASEPGKTYTASQLSQKAIEFIHKQYQAGEKIDGYTAYVLALGGEDLGSEKWTNNGKTLKQEIKELSNLLGDHLTLISYICNTQNDDGSFGPLGNEYGTKGPLLALASIKNDLVPGVERQQVEDAIHKAIHYFQEKYQSGTITYDAQGFSLDYRCIEALVKAGEDLSADGWIYQGTSLRDAVLASAAVTAANPAATAVELAKELAALDAVQAYSANAEAPTLAAAIGLDAANNVELDEATEIETETETIAEVRETPASEVISEETTNETELEAAPEIETETFVEAESFSAIEITSEEAIDEPKLEVTTEIEAEVTEVTFEAKSTPSIEETTEEMNNEVALNENVARELSVTDEVYSDIVTEINLNVVEVEQTLPPTDSMAPIHEKKYKAPDAADLANSIAQQQAADGSFGTSIYDHVTVLHALGKAGLLEGIDQEKALAYIDGLKKIHKDIFGYDAGVAWGSEWTPEEADTTAQVMTALSYFDATKDVNETIQDGLSYLRDVQDPDRAAIAINSWDSTYNTAETLIALKALKRSYDEYAGSGSAWTKKSRTNTLAKCLLALNQWNDTPQKEKLADQLVKRHAGKESFENSVYSDMLAYIALGEAGTLGSLNAIDVKEYILSKQNKADGSWGETFDSYYYPDFLSTTQAIRSLTYLPNAAADQELQSAIVSGLNYLKGLQQMDGGVYATWDDPAMDNSGVIVTLNKLGIDPASAAWKHTNGLTPFDYLLNNTMNPDGSFGTLKNVPGATEALAAYRLVTGEGTPGGGGNLPTDPELDQCSVEIAIVGKNGEALFGPSSVVVSKDSKGKLTVLGALEATGLGYTESGGLITSIDGQRNEGLKGWMYKVNGSSPAIAASDKTVKEGDQIIWWYSSDVSNPGPSWDSVSKGEVLPEPVLSPNLEEQNKNLPESLRASEDTLAALENISQILGLQGNTFELGILGQGGQAVIVVGDRQPINRTDLAFQRGMLQRQLQLQQKVEAAKGAAVVEEGGQLGLLIPAESLTKDIEITVNKLDMDNTTLPPGYQQLSATYEFGPAGTNFTVPATLAIQVVIPPLVKPDNLYLAWYDPNAGNWVIIPSVVDLNKGVIWARIQHFSKYAIFAKETVKSFADVNAGSCGWAKDPIEVLAGANLLAGVDGTNFEPLRPVTRAEFTSMLVKALVLQTKADAADHFKDVKAGEWYAGDLATAYEAGLIKGYKDRYFCPDNTITREEVAAILARALELQPSEQKLPFADRDHVKDWARDSVLAVTERGLVKGFPDETFRPDRTTSRAECAVLIYRLLAGM
ncbi:S-layer homology domain-containing protein [Desulfotomaculum sp. 1211_IL3151]|uniref:S-layer homology domain-containing protein n=1 Tax=Desulfotomaculum sp. 1211_IL3151 TaxID=3084055 RepID=UPI002FDA41E8